MDIDDHDDEEESVSVEEARTARLKHTKKSADKAKPKELAKLASMPGNLR